LCRSSMETYEGADLRQIVPDTYVYAKGTRSILHQRTGTQSMLYT
jgi:hypothetical protein